MALAYAMDPRRSWDHMRLSKLMDSLNFSMMGSTCPENRPPVPKRPPREPSACSDMVVSGEMSSIRVML